MQKITWHDGSNRSKLDNEVHHQFGEGYDKTWGLKRI